MRPKPLAGVRVLDLTRLLPGPVCTLHLADLGADVVKIEEPGVGDYARHMGPDGAGAFFRCVNRNKRGLTLDLREAQGRELFLALARTASVVVESFRPGVVDRLGVGYEATRAVNPRIVYCAITGYGQTGPYRDRAGHDLNYCAYAGIADQIGAPGGPPVVPNFQIADLAGGALSAAMGILAALFDAQRSGAGRYVDVAMTDCALAHAVIPLATHHERGRTAARGADQLTGVLPAYAVYETGDGRYLAVAALEEKFWRAFCDAIERPDLGGLGLTEGLEGARARREVAAVLATRPRDEWAARLAGADCCVAPVLTLEEAMADPQLRAREMFVVNEEPDGRRLTQLAFPIKLSDFDFAVGRAAPGLGEHSAEILAEVGVDAAHLARLRAAGVS